MACEAIGCGEAIGCDIRKYKAGGYVKRGQEATEREPR